MLDRLAPQATLAVADMERAKSWYADKLDLKPAREDPQGTWYEFGGGGFFLFPSPYAGTAKNTVMGWTVEDVGQVVAELKGRGVNFDTFEMEGSSGTVRSPRWASTRARGSQTAKGTSSRSRTRKVLHSLHHRSSLMAGGSKGW